MALGLPDWSGDPNADAASYARNFTVTVTATPCPVQATPGQRVEAGVEGALNIGVGIAKTNEYAALGTVGIVGAPETGGTSLLAAAFAGYGILTSQAQIASGMGQLVTAITGDQSAGQGIQQVGDIMQGPLTGIPTLLITNNPATAQKVANVESTFTAGSGFINNAYEKTLGTFVRDLVDFSLNEYGLFNDISDNGGCN